MPGEHDPDNPDSIFEEMGRREEQRKANGGKTDEPQEEGFIELETDGLEPAVLEEEEAVVRESLQRSPENGTARGNFYDLILKELEDINGYNPDLADVDLYGAIVDEEISSNEVSAVYTLEEQLVDTAGDITIPGLDFADQETLSLAYSRDGLDVGIERTEDGSYMVKASYEEPEDLEEAAREVAVAIAEFEEEFTSAYEF